MPTYKIKQPSLYQDFVRQMLLSAGQAGIHGVAQAAGDQRDLERQKALLTYKNQLEQDTPEYLSKATIEQLQVRKDRLKQELAVKENESVKSMNVDQLKAISKANKDLEFLDKVLKRKMEERSKEEAKESLEMGLRQAQKERVEAETKLLTGARGKLVEAQISETGARTRKILEAVSKDNPTEFQKNYTTQLNRTSDVTDALEKSGHLLGVEDLDLYLQLLPEVLKENKRNKTFNAMDFVLRSLAGSPVRQMILDRLNAGAAK